MDDSIILVRVPHWKTKLAKTEQFLQVGSENKFACREREERKKGLARSMFVTAVAGLGQCFAFP